jgi:Cys-tRNA(Pro)/Cys-tRNA(Cys) deacylase
MTEKLQELKAYLNEQKADYQILEHPKTLISAEDGEEYGIGSLAEMAPTLILETEKGLLAAIISGETKLSYKKIKKELGLKNVSLARPEKVLELVGVPVGIVPLVLHNCPTIIDSHTLLFKYVFGGCGADCHTLEIAPKDLVRLNDARVFDFCELKCLGC